MIKRPFIISGQLGLLMLTMTLVFLIGFPQKATWLPEGFFTPIIAFEFIETEQEVIEMFTAPDGTVDRELVKSMDGINHLDFLYMVVYSLFLMTFAWTSARLSGKKYLYIAVVLAGVVLIFDFLENIQLLGITSKLESRNFTLELARLHIFTWIKWGGIATIFLLLVPYFSAGGIFSKVMAWSAAVTFLLGLGAFLHRCVLNEIFSLCVGLMFLSIMIYSYFYTSPEGGGMK